MFKSALALGAAKIDNPLKNGFMNPKPGGFK